MLTFRLRLKSGLLLETKNLRKLCTPSLYTNNRRKCLHHVCPIIKQSLILSKLSRFLPFEQNTALKAMPPEPTSPESRDVFRNRLLQSLA